MTCPSVDQIRARVTEAAPGASALAVAASLVDVVGAAVGWSVPAGLRVEGVARVPGLLDVEVPAELATPDLLGVLYEAALASQARDAGAHYTPVDLAARLVHLVTGPVAASPGSPRAWDPACGGGAFLLATAEALLARGLSADEIVAELIWGTDLDPGAVAVAEAALCWWAQRHGSDATPGPHLAVADPLLDVVPARPRSERGRLAAAGPLPVAAAGGFDLVVGNPPFQGQLAGASVRSAETTAALRRRWGRDVVRPYSDTAAIFLVAGARALAPGGRLAMVLPTSVLAARDAAPARAVAAGIGNLTDLWVAAEPVFGAAVEVCAVVLERPLRPPSSTGAGSTQQAQRFREPSSSGRKTVPGVVEPGQAGSAPARDEASAVLGSPHPATGTTGAADPGDAPSVPVSDEASEVRRWRGRKVERLAPSGVGSVVRTGGSAVPGDGWAALALAALGVPDPAVCVAGRLGDIATTRAGFRDEYYGLVGHVIEAPVAACVEPPDRRAGDAAEGCPDGHVDGISVGRAAGLTDRVPAGLAALVTSGLVDPGHCAWGKRPASFDRQRYERPAVDLGSLEQAGGRAHTWVRSLLVPKVVVATQTRVGEAAVDLAGRWVASTPTIAVIADPARLWEVAAVVCSPVGTIAALAATAGSARARDAIRHTASTVAGLPLPVDHDAWSAGAEALRRWDRPAFLSAMAAAYAVPAAAIAEVDDWWSSRAPWPG
ncbi:MAG: hypothetical protein JWM47_1341 [Acidimicrobiales bacterium]|nr:hypothetical protein [Acidimicrobiales bacterium]